MSWPSFGLCDSTTPGMSTENQVTLCSMGLAPRYLCTGLQPTGLQACVCVSSRVLCYLNVITTIPLPRPEQGA